MKLAGRAVVTCGMSETPTDPATITLRPRLGESIRQAAARMVTATERERATVGANGQRLTAKPGTNAEDIILAFWGKQAEQDPSVLTIG